MPTTSPFFHKDRDLYVNCVLIVIVTHKILKHIHSSIGVHGGAEN